MKKIFYILVSAIVALGAVACNNEIDENIEVNNGGEVSFTVSLDDRVIIGDRDETTKQHPITFEKGDVIYASNDAVKPFTFVCDNVTAEGVATFICREQNEEGKLPTEMDGKTLNFYTNLEPNSEAGADGIVLKADNVRFEDKEGMSITLSLDCPVFAYTATDAVVMTASTPIFNKGGTLVETIDIAATTEVSFIAIQDNGNEKVKVEYSIAGTKVKEFELDFQPMIYNLGVLTTAVATVGDKTYTVLQTAIDKAAALGTPTEVTIANDSELDATVTIPAGADIVLNLNGNTLKGTSDVAGTSAMFENNGTLTIKGNGGLITYEATAPSTNAAYASNTISNRGTLVVGGKVTIENTTNASASYAIDNYAGSTCTIQDNATVKAAKTAVRIFNWDANKNTTLNVEGGTILSEDGYAINTNTGEAPNYTINISGGTITTNDTDYNLAVYMIAKGTTDGSNYKFNVTGGTFNGAFAINGNSCTLMKEGNVEISGGTFNGGVIAYGTPAVKFIKGGEFSDEDPSDYVVDGYVARDNGNGTWSVLGAVAEVNGVQYALVDDAFAAIESTGTVKLIGDATVTDDVTITVGAGKDITLDLNDKTLTAVSKNTGKNYILFNVTGGTLTVKGGTVEYTHNGDDMAWSNMTTVYSISGGGVVNIEDATIVNKGGSTMAFVAHLNNWGEVTLNVKNSTLESTYIPVRVFNSGYDKNNVTIEGTKLVGKYNVWVHNYIGDLDATKHTNKAINDRLNLDIFGNDNTYEYTSTATSPIFYGFNDYVYFNPENGNRVVGSAYDLELLAKYVNEGIESFAGKTVEVVKDIDLSGIANWIPIGVGGNHFKGTFDGQDHIISNMTIAQRIGTTNQAALFGTVSGKPTIKNLTISKANVTYPNDGTDDFYAAGLIGTYYGNLTVENVTVTESYFSGNNKVAGLIAHDGSSSSLNITNCHVTKSTMESVHPEDGGNVAGILGLFQQSTHGTDVINTIKDCTVTECNIIGVNKDGVGKRANAQLVGAIGASYDDTTLVIENCKVENNTFVSGNDNYVSPYGDGSLVGGYRTKMGTVIIDGKTCVAAGVMLNQAGEYEILNANGLKWFRDTVNAQLNDIFDGATVNLMNDIDLGGEEWIPVGDYRNSSGTQFGSAAKPSKFNGNYHTIKNFKVTQKTAKGDSNKSSYGLFANVHADIENLTVQDAVVDLSNATSCGYVGALVGRLNGGSLTNCHVVNATVAASFWQAGALVGQMNSNGKISGCSVTTANIAAQSAVGSLVGIICNGGENVIENSEATNVNITMLDNSYGDNYKKMFGALVGALYNGARTTYLNNCEFDNVTVKGQASNIAVGSYEEGDIVYIDGYQFITDGVMIADLGQGAYEISNVNGFKWFRDTVNAYDYINGVGERFEGRTVKLMNNIDLGGEEWTPIGFIATDGGSASVNYKPNFRGTFDGNGKIVSNFKVNDQKRAGLFGALVSATIKNLTVSDAELNSNHYAGGILAWGESGATRIVIDGCSVKNVKLTSTPELVNSSYDNGDKVGGIAGFLHVGTIKNCSVENVNIKAYRDMGGILGCADTGTKNAANEAIVINNKVSNVNIEVDNTQNYKDYKIQKDYNVGNYVGSNRGIGIFTITGNTGEVNIEWNGIMKNGAGFSAEAGGTDFDW